jgi:hypothetical protein
VTRHRPTTAPLTTTERAQLDRLIRHAARHSEPTVAGPLLRLWEHDLADRDQERRSAGGAARGSIRLAQQLRETTARAEQAEQRYDDERATAVTRAHNTDRVRRDLTAAEARIAALQAECDGLAEASRNESRIWAAQAAAVRTEITSMTGGGHLYGKTLADQLAARILDALDGPAAPAAFTLPQFGPTGAIPTQAATTTLPALADLYATITAQANIDAAHREAKIAASLAASYTVVRVDPVEQVAAEPGTVARLKAEFAAAPEDRYPANWGPLTLQGSYGAFLPVITDDTLPVDEVHLRPHPRPEAEPERPAGWCPTCEGQPRDAS